MFGNGSGLNANLTAGSPEFASDVSRLALMVLLVIAITLGNLLSLLVFLGVKPFRTSQGYLRASLALADLAVGLLIVPYSVYREAGGLLSSTEPGTGPSDQLACLITGPIFAGCTFVSSSTIFLLSLERSVAVLWPLQKKRVVTKRRTLWLILASWALSFALAVIPLLSDPGITFRYSSCSKMCSYAFPLEQQPESRWNVMLLYPLFDFSLLGSTLAINAVTFATLHRYGKMRKRLGGGAQHSFSDDAAAKTIGILTFAFSVSFIPIAVYVAGSVAGHQWCQFSFYAFWILTANSCWNVAIYSVWDPKFRQGVRELFSKQGLLTPAMQPPAAHRKLTVLSLPTWAALKEMFCPGRT